MRTVDLNADLGEECGDDAALLGLVTTASVAAGGHAGGGTVLQETVRAAAAAGVVVGAHPSYSDRAGFGRVSRAADVGPAGVAALVRTQVPAVARACAEAGIRLSHVKAHGALYADIARDGVLAEAFLDGVADVERALGGPGLAVMGMPGTELERQCRRRNVPYLREAFVDRAYASDGSLLPRGMEGAVIEDARSVAERAVLLATEGAVTAADGTLLELRPDTLCLHGDTAGAVGLARQVRDALESQGIGVRAPGR